MPEHEPHAMIPSTFGPATTPSVTDDGIQSSSQPTLSTCELTFQLANYQIPVLVICAICLVVGLVYCFFGYRFLKAVLFMTGLMFGSVLIYLVCDKEKLLPPLGNAGVALGSGVLFGLITMLVEYVGLFLSGFLTGLLLGVVMILILDASTAQGSIWLSIGVLFGCGLLLALLTLNWSKLFVVLGTALMGGALMVVSLDYFVQRFGLVKWVWDVLNARAVPSLQLCWFGWLLIGLWPSIFLLGAVVQWRLTGAGLQHKAQIHSPRRKRHGNRRGSGQRLTEVRTHKDHERPVGSAQPPTDGATSPYPAKSFRQLYQARQKHGDVICQSHLESLERVRNQRLHNQTTLSSDHTHLTVLSDASTTVIES